ncbi:MAG TPA: FG-GAP-like repeat-containing protein [Anaerolineales bacterium]|nr:FG-GAP-like repeat-containing protein [Anaerolineales bacterium]
MKSRYLHGRFFWTFLLSMAILVSATQASAQSTQSPSFTIQSYPLLANSHIAVDLNGDGILDLAGPGANGTAVMLGNADGTFRARVNYPTGGQTQDLAAGDFNSDGKQDLAVSINSAQISLSLLMGNGDGTFNAPVNFPNTTGVDAPAIVATDVNNDTRLDLLIAHTLACFTGPCVSSDDLTIMLGNGDGTFQSQQMDVGIGMAEIAVGDFNRDGIKDLAIPGSQARLFLLNGVGDGTFVQQPTLQLITESPFGRDGTDVDVGDFNRDNIQDLVVAVALNGSNTVILIGNGDGTFRAPHIITEPRIRIPQYQAVADYNGDGSQDLALALGDGSSGLMEILKGNGDGTFQPLVLYDIPPDKTSVGGGDIVAGDFNRDGRPDIALQVRGAFPALHILINTTNAPPPGPPAAPSLVSPANNATLPLNQSITFSWNPVAGAATYQIQIDDSSSFSSPLVLSRTGLTQTQTTHTFSSERTFWWRVRGRTASGTNGAWSTVRSFVIRRLTTPTPTRTPTLTATQPLPTATGPSATPTVVTPTSTLTPTPTRTATIPAADTVSIQLAEYDADKDELRVEATGSNASATLRVYVTSTNTLIGTLTNEGGGRYRGEFSWPSNPQSITVRSSLGGQATRTVTLK